MTTVHRFHCRYLELDSTAGDKGPLSKALHSSWVKASLCGLIIVKTSYVEALLGVWHTLPQKGKGSGFKFWHGQALHEAKFGLKILTQFVGGTA